MKHKFSMLGRLGIVVLTILAVTVIVSAGTQELTYNAINNATNVSYDELNRVLSKNFTSGYHNYAYDVAYLGTLTNVTFVNGSVAYEYDDRLRVIREVKFIDNLKFERAFDYDSTGRTVKQVGNPGTELGYIYSEQGFIDEIVGFINKTKHNAFGRVLNRTYFNGKVTNFTYNKNTRLERINTNESQNIVYGYDAAGNVVTINDTANNRQQVMVYDHLDRLVNMSLNGGQSFVYRYDAIGNLLSIMRDGGSITILSYDGGPVHAPSTVFTSDANANVNSVVLLNNSNKSKVFEFRIINDRNDSANNVNWTVNFGDGSDSSSVIDFNLDVNEDTLVFTENEYSAGGGYGVNVTVGNLDSPSGFDEDSFRFGVHIDSVELTSRIITNISYKFDIKNDLINSVSGISWECNNGLYDTGITADGMSNKTIEEVYNYSSAGLKELNCSVSSSDGNDNAKTFFDIKGIEIDSYNRTHTDGNTVNLRFNITNHFYSRAVDWRIVSDGQTFTGTNSSIATGASAIISQAIDYTTPGRKEVYINITSGRNLSDSLSDVFVLKALEIEDYSFSNTTLTNRTFEFLIKNYWSSSLTSNWNITDPFTENLSFNLDSGDSVLVRVSADYGTQGVKKPVVHAYSGSFIQSVTERFTNKLVEILNFRTLVEDKSSSVTEALVESNKDSYDVSWTFQTGDGEVVSKQVTTIDASDDVLVIIESDYSDSNVYNTSLYVNSSSFNDSAKGVIIT
jgi:YD repeat-containing protein